MTYDTSSIAAASAAVIIVVAATVAVVGKCVATVSAAESKQKNKDYDPRAVVTTHNRCPPCLDLLKRFIIQYMKKWILCYRGTDIFSKKQGTGNSRAMLP